MSFSFKKEDAKVNSKDFKENYRKNKKDSFQMEKPEQYHLMGNEEEKRKQKYIEQEYLLFNKNFFCLINNFYYIYKFFFENGELIKEILGYLNAYHYSLEDEPLYNVEINEVVEKIQVIYNNVEKLFKNFSIWLDK